MTTVLSHDTFPKYVTEISASSVEIYQTAGLWMCLIQAHSNLPVEPYRMGYHVDGRLYVQCGTNDRTGRLFRQWIPPHLWRWRFENGKRRGKTYFSPRMAHYGLENPR